MRLCLTLRVVLAVSMLSQSANAQYALFDEGTDTIRVEGHTVLGTQATYEARFQLQGSGGRMFNEWQDGQEDKDLHVTQDEFWAFSFPVNKSNGALTASTTITPNQWHHIAYVYDGSEERLYLDGQLQTLRASSGDIWDSTGSTASIGAFLREGLRTSFIGLLDTFRISDAALYSGVSFAPPAGDLSPGASTQLLYNFNEPHGSLSITDLSPNAVVGTFGVGFTGATSPTLVPEPTGAVLMAVVLGVGCLCRRAAASFTSS